MSPTRREFLRLLATGAAVGSVTSWAQTQPGGKTAARGGQDEYWPQSLAAYDQRRQALLEYCAASSSGGRTGFWSQIARLELDRPIDDEPFREAIDFVYSNRDCNDFTVGGLLRVMYRYRHKGGVPSPLLDAIQTCLLKFKYWWDEPGTDDRCYHTENHQIIFHMDQLLAGQLYPDRTFEVSGQSGLEHVALALPRIRRWMDWRVRFGFSEWLSNCYFVEDLMALTNLRDFAAQPDIRSRAEMLIDVLLFEMAIHSHRGVFGSTHGRTYAPLIKGGRSEGTSTVCKLMFGTGLFNSPENQGALALATSPYRCPPPLEAIAADLNRTILCRERHSLNVEDAPRHGLSYDKEEDVLLYWSIQEYIHPLVLDASEKISKTHHVRNFAWSPSRPENYDSWREQYRKQVAEHGRIVDPWLDSHALGEVHIHTLRTPTGMLSCAQDYRPGKGGYQQHIWQATLGLDAVVFTNHPGSDNESGRPNFWAGNGILPRAAQYRQVLVCIHHVPADNPFPFSHAYFPRAAFDEVVDRMPWTFARKGDGYLALYSQKPTQWRSDADGKTVELRVLAADNIWICEMGSKGSSGDFNQFVQALSAAPVRCEGLRIRYRSPFAKEVSFGWEDPLRIAGAEVLLHDSPRFDNPYCRSAFLSPHIEIRHGQGRLTLDFDSSRREMD